MPYPDVRLLYSNASYDTLFYRFSILTIVLASERENPLARMVTPPLVSMVMSQNMFNSACKSTKKNRHLQIFVKKITLPTKNVPLFVANLKYFLYFCSRNQKKYSYARDKFILWDSHLHVHERT